MPHPWEAPASPPSPEQTTSLGRALFISQRRQPQTSLMESLQPQSGKGQGSKLSSPRTTQDIQLLLSATRMEGALTNISGAIISRQRSSLMPLGLSNMSTPQEQEVTTDNLALTSPGLFPPQLSLPRPSQQTPEKRARHPVGAMGDVRLHTDPKQFLSSFPRHSQGARG